MEQKIVVTDDFVIFSWLAQSRSTLSARVTPGGEGEGRIQRELRLAPVVGVIRVCFSDI